MHNLRKILLATALLCGVQGMTVPTAYADAPQPLNLILIPAGGLIQPCGNNSFLPSIRTERVIVQIGVRNATEQQLDAAHIQVDVGSGLRLVKALDINDREVGMQHDPGVLPPYEGPSFYYIVERGADGGSRAVTVSANATLAGQQVSASQSAEVPLQTPGCGDATDTTKSSSTNQRPPKTSTPNSTDRPDRTSNRNQSDYAPVQDEYYQLSTDRVRLTRAKLRGRKLTIYGKASMTATSRVRVTMRLGRVTLRKVISLRSGRLKISAMMAGRARARSVVVKIYRPNSRTITKRRLRLR